MTDNPSPDARSPEPLRIVIVVPSGETVRNFLYSRALELVAAEAEVTLLSVVHDDEFVDRFSALTTRIVPLEPVPEHRLLARYREVLHYAHFRWLWSKVAQNNWEIQAAEAQSTKARVRWGAHRAAARALGHEPVLRRLTQVEQRLSLRLRPTDRYDELFDEIRPDLVFNGQHVHGPVGDLPMRVAAERGIRTAAFIYSWDNLTSRSRIVVPYDEYLVWSRSMDAHLRRLYDWIPASSVHVTGTPQFDFHFDDRFLLSRTELARRIGVDSERPFILWTTGADKHFPEEHRFVLAVHELLQQLDLPERPQLVVRTYAKGTSPEMRQLMDDGLPDTVFPPVLWDERLYTAAYEDMFIYSSLLHHCAMGINPASTVTLELLALGKPVMNLGFDPPGSDLPWPDRWARHIEFDHYAPVAASGGPMVARRVEDLERFLRNGLTDDDPSAPAARRAAVEALFGNTFDGQSGRRCAEALLEIAHRARAVNADR